MVSESLKGRLEAWNGALRSQKVQRKCSKNETNDSVLNRSKNQQSGKKYNFTIIFLRIPSYFLFCKVSGKRLQPIFMQLVFLIKHGTM